MWVNKSEIEGYKEKISYLEEQIDKHLNDKCELETKISDKSKKISELELKVLELTRINEDTQKENEMLRKYYHLDEEPSDDVKMKIHIDLEINRLKEENIKLLLAIRQTSLIPTLIYPYGFNNFQNIRI